MTYFAGYLMRNLAIKRGRHQILRMGARIGGADQGRGPEAEKLAAAVLHAELKGLFIGEFIFRGSAPVTKSQYQGSLFLLFITVPFVGDVVIDTAKALIIGVASG